MTVITLEGGKKLARRFAMLQREARGPVLVAATIAGAAPIRDEAERLAPKAPGSGRGARNIKFREGKVTRTVGSTDIGYDKRLAWHMLFQELGTKFHGAQPHLRPAMDNKKEEAARAVGRVLKLGIDAVRRAR